jgi:hypothetical protein
LTDLQVFDQTKFFDRAIGSSTSEELSEAKFEEKKNLSEFFDLLHPAGRSMTGMFLWSRMECTMDDTPPVLATL